MNVIAPTTTPLFVDSRWAVIDFETATSEQDSACAIGVVLVDGHIVGQHRSLIRPSENDYDLFNVDIHGRTPQRRSRFSSRTCSHLVEAITSGYSGTDMGTLFMKPTPMPARVPRRTRLDVRKSYSRT